MSFNLNHVLTHEENRSKICFVCLKKDIKTMLKLEGALKSHVNKLFNINFDIYLKDFRYPSAICFSCKRKIYKCLKITENSVNLKLPDFSKFESIIIITSSGKCECFLCDLSRIKFKNKLSNKNKSLEKNLVKLTNGKEKKCDFCLAIIKKALLIHVQNRHK